MRNLQILPCNQGCVQISLCMLALYLFLLGAAKFIYSNPAVSLLAFLLSVQFGCMSTAVLLGGVPMKCYLGNGDIPTVGLAAGVWFMVFFSPFDLFYKICNISVVKVRVCIRICMYVCMYSPTCLVKVRVCMYVCMYLYTLVYMTLYICSHKFYAYRLISPQYISHVLTKRGVQLLHVHMYVQSNLLSKYLEGHINFYCVFTV